MKILTKKHSKLLSQKNNLLRFQASKEKQGDDEEQEEQKLKDVEREFFNLISQVVALQGLIFGVCGTNTPRSCQRPGANAAQVGLL